MGSIFGPAVAVFFFLAVGALALFGFLAVATWSGSRSSERIAYYENETLKKLIDSSSESARQALEYLREEKRLRERRRREGLKLGGLVTAAIGVALMVFVRTTSGGHAIFVGSVPLSIGVAILIYVFAMAPKEQS